MIIVNLGIFFFFFFAFNKLYMPGSYVAFNLLPSDPFDLLASCIVSLTQRINKYVCMYVLQQFTAVVQREWHSLPLLSVDSFNIILVIPSMLLRSILVLLWLTLALH